MGADGAVRLGLRHPAARRGIAGAGAFGGAGGRRPVGLTEAGTLLLEHSEAVLARLRVAQTQLDALGQGDAGTLRVGTYQSVGIRVLPDVAARVAETHPDLRLEIHEAGCDLELLDRVEHGELDVTFCVLPAPEGPLTTEELLEDPYRLLVPAGSPLLEDGEVRLEALGSLPLIGYRGCRTEERVFSYLRGLGIDVKRVAYARDNAIIQAMVAAGRGAALLTQLSIDESDPQTATLELADWMPRRRVGLGWHPERASSPALEAFIATAREVTRPRRERIRSAA